ncbi:SET domain [Seminavis robusta]|uniref:SET domain n=1 Tax=Seminavis robusta TaxID=568900 RepID=A0A9N8DD58_9STRA|nr:SET domain [Seminavis robusta]|eukprot:Sro41_g025130.1 SET domain (306) ;mRNA; f:60735-61745
MTASNGSQGQKEVVFLQPKEGLIRFDSIRLATLSKRHQLVLAVGTDGVSEVGLVRYVLDHNTATFVSCCTQEQTMDPPANDHTSSDNNVLFQSLQKRLNQLEIWREIAVRPTQEECHQQDWDLWESPTDDLVKLSMRCISVRAEMNANLPVLVDPQDDNLCSAPSTIPGDSGLGLFLKPLDGKPLRQGDRLCYYYGHIHNFQSAKLLEDRSYLLGLHGDLMVDAGPACLRHIHARFINDPLNEAYVNCQFIPDKEDMLARAAVVSTREIQPEEELFVAYGDAYWSQQTSAGTVMPTVVPPSINQG